MNNIGDHIIGVCAFAIALLVGFGIHAVYDQPPNAIAVWKYDDLIKVGRGKHNYIGMINEVKCRWDGCRYFVSLGEAGTLQILHKKDEER